MHYTALAALGLLSSAYAHMQLMYPPPFRSTFNPNKPTNIDYSMTSPLSGAAQFPCKGYNVDLGTPGGASVATWQAGGAYNFSVTGGAVHGGGSCQAALSYDKGVSFKVIHSYIGSCPLSDGQKFDFTIPSDAPVADNVIFSWTWYNEIGNREIYQNCAAIDISAGSSSPVAPKVAFAKRPDIFVANLANGCVTVETKDVIFPNPGPDVTTVTKIADDGGSLTGTCQAVKGIGGEAGTAPAGYAPGQAPGGSASAGSTTVTTLSTSTILLPATSAMTLSIIPSATIAAGSSTTISPTGSNAPYTFFTAAPMGTGAAAPSLVPTGAPSGSSNGLTVTEDGECSGQHTCNGSIHGPCCSQWGWCGSTDAYCGMGCQAGFGQCGSFTNSTVPAATTSLGMKKRGPRRFTA